MNVFHKEVCTEINQDTILRNVSRIIVSGSCG